MCAKEKMTKRQNKEGGAGVCVGESEFEALLPTYIAAQITNLGALIPASRCNINPRFEANHPVMILLIANTGSDGR